MTLLAMLVVLAAACAVRGEGESQGAAPGVDDLLLQMEAAGNRVSSLSSAFTYSFKELEEEDEDETRVHSGVVRLQKNAGGTRALIRFDSWQDGEIVNREDRRWYLFDGVFLIEAREKEQRRIRQQIVKDGQRFDPFRLGEGPFPLPFGQTRDDMHRQFEISQAADDDKGRPHLVCIPRPDSGLARRYQRVDLFLGSDSVHLGLVERMVLHDRKDRQLKTVEFGSLLINLGISEKDLALPRETDAWTQSDQAFDQD